MKNVFQSPIDHNVLPNRIIDFIRDKIIIGEIKAGEKVSEAKLSEELQISRTPIREAIRLLECEGFIEIIPRKGAVVKSFSKEDIINTFEVKAVVEALGVSKTSCEAAEKDISKLESFIDNESKYIEKNEVVKFFKEYDKFNSTLIKNCTNQYLIEINLKMNNHTLRYRYFCFKYPDTLSDITNYQKKIVADIKNRDVFNLRIDYENYIKDIGIKIAQKVHD